MRSVGQVHKKSHTNLTPWCNSNKGQRTGYTATYLENSSKRRFIVVREHLVQAGESGLGRNRNSHACVDVRAKSSAAIIARVPRSPSFTPLKVLGRCLSSFSLYFLHSPCTDSRAVALGPANDLLWVRLQSPSSASPPPPRSTITSLICETPRFGLRVFACCGRHCASSRVKKNSPRASPNENRLAARDGSIKRIFRIPDPRIGSQHAGSNDLGRHKGSAVTWRASCWIKRLASVNVICRQ